MSGSRTGGGHGAGAGAGGAAPALSPAELAALEAAVASALAGDASAVEVVAYGEISAVIAWRTAAGSMACKRLPEFTDRARLAAYRARVGEYLAALRARGVTPVETAVVTTEADESNTADDAGASDTADDGGAIEPADTGGPLVAYCVQPLLDPARLAPAAFARADDAGRARLFERLLDHVWACVDARLGLDAQLSNWAITSCDGDEGDDGDRRGLLYLDVSTPLMRTADGAELLDTELFLASLPAALRPLVRRFALSSILDKYYSPRGAVLDLLGNLHKQRDETWIPALLPLANRRLDPPLTEREIAGYYRADARTWAFLQAARRLDRFWQRTVRRRAYPFLLPGRIERNR